MIMGKGDKRTRRGKIFAGSYGKSRPKNKTKAVPKKENTTTSEE
jgi:30S ribosomal protein S31